MADDPKAILTSESSVLTKPPVISPPPTFRQRLYTILWQPEPAPKLDRVAFRRQLVRDHLLPLGLYLLITLIISFPLILHFGSEVIGDKGDAWQNIWNYWWTGKSLFSFQNPYQTDMLYAPYGAPLYLHSLNLFNGLVSLPMQGLFGVVAAYNFVVLVSFTLTGYWTYLLVRLLTGDRRAGFVSGVIVAFSSYMTNQLYLGQANLFAAEWIPAYIYALCGAVGSQGRRRTLFGLLAVVSLVCAMLCDQQYVLFLAVFMGVYCLYTLISKRSWQPLAIVVVTGLAFVIIVSPILIKTFQFINSKAVPPTSPSFVLAYSGDLWSFFLPSPRHFLLGSWSSGLAPDAIEMSHNRAVFLGALPVLLALLGFVRAGGQRFMWLGLSLLSFVLALGPVLQINGERHNDIKLPFGIIENIPGLNIDRVPVRFVLLILLSLAVLGGFGIVTLQKRLLYRLNPPLQLLALGGIVALLLAEHLIAPFPSEVAQHPPFYEQLGRSNEPGTILEIPYSKSHSLSLYYQTIHHHPMLGGYLSRVVNYPIASLPPIQDSPTEAAKDITVQNMSQSDLGAAMLKYEDVKWIVILLKDPLLDKAGLPGFLSRYTQGDPIYQDEIMLVYRPKPAPDASFLIQVEGGWDAAEPSDVAPTKQMRWFERRGGLYAWNVSGQTRQVSFSFDVWSYHQPRHLTVRYDGADVGEWTISDLKHLDISLSMPPGQHQIELRAPSEEPTRPVDIGQGKDTRPLSFGVSNLLLTPR